MSKKSKKRNERIEVLEQKDIKKQNKVLFETKQCFCCGEIFEVYPYIEKNPEHIASNNLPWMPYGSYFIKVEDFTEQWSGECIFIKKPFSLKEANKKFNLF